MVNMSTSNENGNMEKPCTTIRVGEDSRPCCSVSPSSPQRIEESDPQGNLKRSSSPHSDSNKHHISTNGTYPSIISTSVRVVGTYENGESSGMEKCTTQFVCGNNKQNEINSDQNNKEILLRSSVESDQGNKSSSGGTPKLPDCLKSKVVRDYDRNSSSEDEECCIYTYKGDSNQMADLPSSFFRLDLISSRPNGNTGHSSPDMDYLEMDFDPGPSNDRYSSSGSECDEELFVIKEVPRLPEGRGELSVRDPEPTPPSPLSTPSPTRFEQACSSAAVTLRSPPSSPLRQASVQPSFCYCIANKLSPISIDENFNEGGAGTMVWKDQEAKEKQVNQIAISACGATAVINCLLGLNVPFSISSVKHHVGTRLRNETAPIVEYLQSRCHAGATHVDIIRGLHNASNELVYARFFHMYPQRSMSLTSWLSHWIRKGAVPIVTRNLQRGVRPDMEVPDVWHHQMVYGVSAQGIHLTNPLEVQSEALLWPQLASPSLLKVRREDVISRWTPDTPLHQLAHPSLPLWRKLNVLGQVVNVIRESRHCSQPSQHITIPASYCSGVILAVLRNSPAYEDLRFTPELPIDPFASS